MHIDYDAPIGGHPLHRLAASLADRLRHRRRRRKFSRLLDLDDTMLKDIGVTRGEVEIATRLPLSVNAATELRRMSLARRRSRM